MPGPYQRLDVANVNQHVVTGDVTETPPRKTATKKRVKKSAAKKADAVKADVDVKSTVTEKAEVPEWQSETPTPTSSSSSSGSAS